MPQNRTTPGVGAVCIFHSTRMQNSLPFRMFRELCSAVIPSEILVFLLKFHHLIYTKAVRIMTAGAYGKCEEDCGC